MRSNVCKISNGHYDIAELLCETEKVTDYNELAPKDALSLRLLAEELVGMLPAIVKDYDGEFWIENEDSEYRLCVRMSVRGIDAAVREELISVSSNNENASATGLAGRICAAFDYLAMGVDDGGTVSPEGRYGLATNIDFSYLWSLNQYKDDVAEEPERWDELEKSIIAKLADDVTVGVRGKKVNIIIKKKF